MEQPALLLRAEEAAKILAIGRSKVFQLLASGELPAIRIGRLVRVRRSDLERWIEERRTAETDRPTIDGIAK